MSDAGSPNAVSAKTTQTVDHYGNVTQSAIYPYNNSTTPLKVLTNTYETNSFYISTFQMDRVASLTITTGGNTITVVSNSRVGVSGTGQPAKNCKAGEEVRAGLEKLGIIRDTGHEHFNGSITIPVFDAAGRVVGM